MTERWFERTGWMRGRRLRFGATALGLLGVALAACAAQRSGDAEAAGRAQPLSAPPRPQPLPARQARAPSTRAPVSRVTGAGLFVRRRPQHERSEAGDLILGSKRHLIVEQYSSPCNGGRDSNTRHNRLEDLLSDGCLFGPRCLVFEGFAAADGCGSDRIEVNVAECQSPEALRFGETRYLRFFLKVDPALGNLKNSALISQVWQASSVAVGQRPALGPAFAISISTNPQDPGLVDVDFRYRNEISAQNPPHFFAQHSIKKDEWHAFHVQMTPRHVGHPDGRGEILVWVDQGLNAALEPTRALNFSASDDSNYRFFWGYPPDPDTKLGSTFDTRLGIYRPEPLVWMKFWLDGVKFTYEKADLQGL